MTQVAAVRSADLLLTGRNDVERPRISVGAAIVALWHAHQILRRLECGRMEEAFSYLRRLRCPPRQWTDAETLLAAHQIVAVTHRFLRLRSPGALARALPRSLAAGAAARAIGIDAHIVIARRTIATREAPFVLYAWLAVADEAINEIPSQQFAYREVRRFP